MVMAVSKDSSWSFWTSTLLAQKRNGETNVNNPADRIY